MIANNEEYESKKLLLINRLNAMGRSAANRADNKISMGWVMFPAGNIFKVVTDAVELLEQSTWNGKTDNK